MKMKQTGKVGRKLLSLALVLALMVGFAPGMGMTARADTALPADGSDAGNGLRYYVGYAMGQQGGNYQAAGDNSGGASLFDGDPATKACIGFEGSYSVEFSYASEITPHNYYFRTGDDTSTQTKRNPSAWKLEGKNTNNTWTVLDEKSEQTYTTDNNTEVKFGISNNTAYQTFRLTITANSSGRDDWPIGGKPTFQLSEVYMSGTIAPASSVASVTSGGTTTEYAIFSAALGAWADGSTLTLLDDVTTDSTINVSGTRTLDLNGYGVLMKGTDRVISVQGNASLTLNDSNPGKSNYITLNDYRGTSVANSGVESFSNGNGVVKVDGGYLTGGIRSSGEDGPTAGAGVLINRGATFVLNGGTIVGNTITNDNSGSGVRNDYGIFTMNGGKITYNKAGRHGGGLTTTGSENCTVHGGEISNNYAASSAGGVQAAGSFALTGGSIVNNASGNPGGGVYANGVLTISGNVKITGNTASGKADNLYLASNNLTVSGNLADGAQVGVNMQTPGVFTNSTDTAFNDASKFISDDAGYAVFQNSSGQLELRVPPVASVTSGGTTTEYMTFADALGAWSDGSTLTLLSDVEASDKIMIPSGKTVTLDLNGHGMRRGSGGSDPTIIRDDGILTIQDSSSEQTGFITRTASAPESGVWINGGTLELRSGTFTGIKSGDAVINNSGTFNMYGGSITGNEGSKGVGVYGNSTFRIQGAANVSGNGSNVFLASGTKIIIAGALTGSNPIGVTMATPGVFTTGDTAFNDASKFISDDAGYAVFQNTSGQLELRVPPAVASVTSDGTTTEYAAFSDALGAWANGSTLTLLSDVTISRTIDVTGTKTLDLNGHGIRMTGSGNVINVGNASLTLNDSAPNAQHKYTIQNPKSNGAGLAVVDDANGTQTFTGGYITGGDTNDRGGGVVVNGGSLTMNGGTVIGNNAANHGGGVALKELGGTFIMNGGALIGNTGKYGGGLSMINASSGTVNGGKIQYNCTSKNGGGIHTDGAGHRASLTVTGGTITNNYCDGSTVSGGGVLVSGMTFNLSGSVEIKDNLRKSGADNLCLIAGKTVIVADTLSNSTPIGVTMQTPGVFTSTASDKVSYNDPTRFVSDDAGYAVSQNSSNQLELVPTVTFDANGGVGTMAEQTVSHDTAVVLTQNAFTRADYTFAGWNTQADGTGTPYADGASVTLTAPLTLYAQWTSKPVYTASGTVKQESDNAPISGATVRLVQGERKLAVTATNDDGAFSFSAPDGIYNIVAEHGGKTRTELVTLRADQQVHIVMPSASVNSVLMVTGDDTPNVMVGGLDELAEQIGAQGASVTVTMTVEKKDENAAVGAEDIKDEADGMSLDYLDISLTETVSSTESPPTPTDRVLEIVVPYDFSKKKQTTVAVYRYHDGSAAPLAESNTRADGTYRLDKDNNLVYIYANRFSTYAIGFTPTYTVSGALTFGDFSGEVTFFLTGNGVEKTASGSVTNGSGNYHFTGVPAGTYNVTGSWTENGKAHSLTFSVAVPTVTP